MRAAEILPPVVEDAEAQGMRQGIPQEDEKATYTPMITKEMGKIDWHAGATEIVRQVRALVLWPTAYTSMEGKMVKVFNARAGRLYCHSGGLPGTDARHSRQGIEVAAEPVPSSWRRCNSRTERECGRPILPGATDKSSKNNSITAPPYAIFFVDLQTVSPLLSKGFVPQRLLRGVKCLWQDSHFRSFSSSFLPDVPPRAASRLLNSLNPTGAHVFGPQEPVRVEGGLDRAGYEADADRRTGKGKAWSEREQPGGNSSGRRSTGRGRKRRSTVVQEANEEGQEMSLFVRKDDGEEEDLASLLTADYLRQFDIPIVFNDAVQYFVKYFTTEKRKIMANWLKRSRRYVPMIKEILREQGLPEDLIYLAMIESGFNPRAYSSMKACGPWQFVYETGGRYGLRVTHWVDERRDPEKSTVAAALYLKDLFNQFGDWYLAAAGYNAGEKRIERAVEQHETSDFWELSKYNTLPRETREYIPRLLAAAIIAKEPQRFGFTNIDYDQPVRFVNEKVPGATSLTVLAKAASTEVTKLRALNPELLTGITPPDSDDYSIKLPEWVDKAAFREGLKAALENEERMEQVITYTFKRRETLAAVMKMYKVTYNDLLLVNTCDQTLVAKQGSVIYIPKFSRETEPAETEPAEAVREAQADTSREPQPEGPAEIRPAIVNPPKPWHRPMEVAQIAPKAEAVSRNDFHIVKKGERLADISEKYGISLATLKEINKLKKSHIYPNMRLELTSSRVRKTEKHVRLAVYHTTRKGEILHGNGRKIRHGEQEPQREESPEEERQSALRREAC